METEEKLSWDAYELPQRNRLRMCSGERKAQDREKERRVLKAKEEARLKEEGFTYHNGVLKEFSRWRNSPALYRSYKGHKGQVYAFKVSESLDCILSASADTTVKLWDFRTGKCVRTFEGHGKAVRDCDLTPGFSIASKAGLGLAVSCSTDKTVRIWDARSGATKKEIRGHTDVVYACCFAPDGRRVASASADRTVRLWDAVEGFLLFNYLGHASAVVSVAFAPSGRYICSSSDFGERAIKLWHADMPAAKASRPIAQRVEWTTGGLIQKFTMIVEPTKALYEIASKGGAPPKPKRDARGQEEKVEDPWTMGSDDEDDAEEERKAKEREAEKAEMKRAKERAESADKKEAGGFALSVVAVDRFGRQTQVTSYYGGVELQVAMRGVDPIGEFFVAGYKLEGVYDAFTQGSGTRVGTFGRDLPLGARDTCENRAVNSRRWKAQPEVVLAWKGPKQGTGNVVIKATVAGAETELGPAPRHQLSYTLNEVDPPKKGSVLSDLGQQKVDKGESVRYDFQAANLHQLFIELIRNGDFTEASNMMAPDVRLNMMKASAQKRLTNAEILAGVKKERTKLKGIAQVMKRLRAEMANGCSIVKDAKDPFPASRAPSSCTARSIDPPPKDESLVGTLDRPTPKLAAAGDGKDGKDGGGGAAAATPRPSRPSRPRRRRRRKARGRARPRTTRRRATTRQRPRRAPRRRRPRRPRSGRRRGGRGQRRGRRAVHRRRDEGDEGREPRAVGGGAERAQNDQADAEEGARERRRGAHDVDTRLGAGRAARAVRPRRHASRRERQVRRQPLAPADGPARHLPARRQGGRQHGGRAQGARRDGERGAREPREGGDGRQERRQEGGGAAARAAREGRARARERAARRGARAAARARHAARARGVLVRPRDDGQGAREHEPEPRPQRVAVARQRVGEEEGRERAGQDV